MTKSKSSKRWLNEHFRDNFVQRSKKQEYRSRSVYKLMEINEKDKILKQGISVLELGAAPGGWTQYVSQQLNGTGVIVASDILAMDGLPDVTFVQGDFREESVLAEILTALPTKAVDLVLSDMAPNLSGVAGTDQARSMYLADLALDTVLRVLKENGAFVSKLFQGEGFDNYIKNLRSHFKKVIIRKPKASRSRSREVYAVALGRII